MQPTILLDREFVVTQSGYAVRALFRLEGRAAPPESAAAGRVPMNLCLVLDQSGSMTGRSWSRRPRNCSTSSIGTTSESITTGRSRRGTTTSSGTGRSCRPVTTSVSIGCGPTTY